VNGSSDRAARRSLVPGRRTLLTRFVALLLEQLFGGWNWPALILAAIESMLTVFGSVWLLSASSATSRSPVALGPPAARTSYAAFMVHSVVLIRLTLALRRAPVVAEVKALAVAVAGIVGSFASAG
jgi:hypothetical protein